MSRLWRLTWWFRSRRFLKRTVRQQLDRICQLENELRDQ